MVLLSGNFGWRPSLFVTWTIILPVAGLETTGVDKRCPLVIIVKLKKKNCHEEERKYSASNFYLDVGFVVVGVVVGGRTNRTVVATGDEFCRKTDPLAKINNIVEFRSSFSSIDQLLFWVEPFCRIACDVVCGWTFVTVVFYTKGIRNSLFDVQLSLTFVVVVIDCCAAVAFFCWSNFVNILNGMSVWLPLILIATICCWLAVDVVWTVGCCCWITVWFKITFTFVWEPIVWLSTCVVSFVASWELAVLVFVAVERDGLVLKL